MTQPLRVNTASRGVGEEEAQLRELVTQLEKELGALEKSVVLCCGATFAQCNAIVEIGKAQSISLNDLAAALGLDKSTASRTVDGLVKADLILREIDSHDRRYVTLNLTEKGRKQYWDIEEGKVAYFNKLFKSLQGSSRTEVLESLSILLKAIRQIDPCVGGK